MCSSIQQENVNFNEFVINAHMALREADLPNFQSLQIPVKSKWNIPFLDSLLVDYHDKQITQFLKFGFPINYQGPVTESVIVKNHRGATDYPVQIRQYLTKEVSEKTLLGPFQHVVLENSILSPLNSTEKKDSVDRRVIHDLSFPISGGVSVNQGINMQDYFGTKMLLQYPTIDTLVDMVVQLGPGCHLYKKDIRKCYKQIPVDYRDINLLGFKFDNHVYYDCTLPMGLASSAFICQRTTNMIRYIATQMGLMLCNYLDDLGGAAPPSVSMNHYMALGRLLSNSGVEENAQKNCPPDTSMVFLGLLLDTIAMTLSVPADKMRDIQELIQKWETKTHMTRTNLESLLGKLNFIAKCVRSGRVFINRMLQALRGLPRTGQVRIPDQLKMDLNWWKRYAPHFNGVSKIPENTWLEPDAVVSCDATLKACGGWHSSGEYFRETFPSEIMNMNLHISALEMLTLVVTVGQWAKSLQNRRIQVYSDNLATVICVNTGKTRDEFMSACLRELVFILATHNAEVKVRHIGTKQNQIPDLLSRWDDSSVTREKWSQLTEGYNVVRKRIKKSKFTKFYNW